VSNQSTDLTAATAAVRTLRAAGWESDYAHKVGDDITVLSMKRGERRITAHALDDDHTVDLELTGLSMDQAAAVAAALAACTASDEAAGGAQ